VTPRENLKSCNYYVVLKLMHIHTLVGWNEGNMTGYIHETGFIVPFSCSPFLQSLNIAGHVYEPAMNLTPTFIANVTINNHLHQECCIMYHASNLLFFANLSFFFTVVSIPVESLTIHCVTG
jgi:hypothetical protein